MPTETTPRPRQALGTQPARRHWLRQQAHRLCALAVGSSIAGVPASVLRAQAGLAAPRFSLTVEPRAPGKPVNRQVLGSNVQWVDGGDDMLDAQGAFKPAMLALAQQMAPTTLRFPGGMQSDVYRWEQGIGPVAQRPKGEHAHSRTERAHLMDTLEFLELCEATGAAPLITVNVMTGDAAEAARWVRATNLTGFTSRRTGARLPAVKQWEIGNEPYLKPDERPDLRIPPAEFAQRANSFIRAMRAVDPSIQIILPLTLDVRNKVPVTPYPGFSRQVLAAITAPIDMVAVHHGYMPFGLDRPGDDLGLYWGAMASAPVVAQDLAAMQRLLTELRPGQRLPLALTEYNAIFTLGNGKRDGLITSPAAAIYLADLLRVTATMDGLAMAHQWSLSGNWFFGAIHSDARPRPGFEALRLMGEALRGQALPAQITSSTQATAAIGLVPAQAALPVVETLVTREGNTLRVLLINKHPERVAQGALDLGKASIKAARIAVLASDDAASFEDRAGAFQRSESTLPAQPQLQLPLPPHSVSLLTFDLAAE
jgi:alpha-N-arabinofuranosidase